MLARFGAMVLLAGPLALLSACDAAEQSAPAETGPQQEPARLTVDPGAQSPDEVQQAIAVLHPTQGNEVRGKVRFEAANTGLKVSADMQGLSPGKHAFHVHLLGDCSKADGTSAGTHFNFDGSAKNPPADIDRITGNLGELEAGDDGKAVFSGLVEQASLQGPYSIVGRSVIVHARANDPDSPPIGAAGSRLACGVIGLTE